MTQATTTIDIPEQLCFDLLTAAVEGGSAYWLRGACDYRGHDLSSIETSPEAPYGYGPYAITECFEAEDEDTKFPDVSLDTMRVGIQRILEGKVKVRKDIIANILKSCLDPDVCDWDAEVADCVLQAGLLNDIVYG